MDPKKKQQRTDKELMVLAAQLGSDALGRSERVEDVAGLVPRRTLSADGVEPLRARRRGVLRGRVIA